MEKDFYYQMLNLAQFYLDNPTIVPCEFLLMIFHGLLQMKVLLLYVILVIVELLTFRQENIIHAICVFRLFVVKKLK